MQTRCGIEFQYFTVARHQQGCNDALLNSNGERKSKRRRKFGTGSEWRMDGEKVRFVISD